MRYLMIVYTMELDFEGWPQESVKTSLAEHFPYQENLAGRGKLLLAERLYPSATATTLRNRASEFVTIDGPLAKTTSQISRIYIFESPDLDQALQIATRILAEYSGAVEVWPIMEIPNQADLGDPEH